MTKDNNAVKALLSNLFEEWFCNLSFQEQVEELYQMNRYWDWFTPGYQDKYYKLVFTFIACLDAGYIKIPKKVSNSVSNKLIKLGVSITRI